MGAHKLFGLLHDPLKITPGELAFVDYSKLLGSLFSWWQSRIVQVKHQPDPLHHLRAAILPEVVVLLDLYNMLLDISL
jgi:hypothetical protein